MIKRRVFSALVLVGITSLLATSSASALDRRVRIYNDTSYTMTHLHGSNIDDDIWRYDWFGLKTLGPGEAMTLSIDEGNGYCRFDLRATFADGSVVTRPNFNVCEEISWGVTERRSRTSNRITLVGQ